MSESIVEVTIRIVTGLEHPQPVIGIGGAYLTEQGAQGPLSDATISRVLLMGLSAHTDAAKGELSPPPKVLRSTADALRVLNGRR